MNQRPRPDFVPAAGAGADTVGRNAEKLLGLANRIVVVSAQNRVRFPETMMQKSRPPFRADHVGSLLRPERIRQARTRFAKGEIAAAELLRLETLEIGKIVQKQKQSGLKLATDGEFRRSWWHFDFLKHLAGCELHKTDGIQFNGMTTRGESIRVTGKLDFPDSHPMLEHFKLLKDKCDLAGVLPKMTIPSPSLLHYRGGRGAISQEAYPEIDDFFIDLAKTYRKAVQAFYDAGCRYLQFDDTVWAYLCSEDQRAKLRGRGEDPDALPAVYARVINYAIAERPADMTITTHVCRGNFRSTWISSGGYEPVAETLLSRVNYDGYFLEYDSERAGGFEPLRFLPKGSKTVVLGLITSKTGALETKDDIKRRVAEAAKFVALDQLALSPQCGFASTEEGNILTEDEQWAKLRLTVDVANEVWGK
jgi:5-methyltetrahydropteroyltriglutamate--homocysteine methyltransferase